MLVFLCQSLIVSAMCPAICSAYTFRPSSAEEDFKVSMLLLSKRWLVYSTHMKMRQMNGIQVKHN